MEKLRVELEAQHQASINQLKAVWSKEKEADIQQQVNSELASAKATWEEELQRVRVTVQLQQFHYLPNCDFML